MKTKKKSTQMFPKVSGATIQPVRPPQHFLIWLDLSMPITLKQTDAGRDPNTAQINSKSAAL